MVWRSLSKLVPQIRLPFLKQIRVKKGLSIQLLPVLSGVPEELLEAAESGRFENAGQ